MNEITNPLETAVIQPSDASVSWTVGEKEAALTKIAMQGTRITTLEEKIEDLGETLQILLTKLNGGMS